VYASFKSIGAYIPAKVLTNSDLEKIVDTNDEWIVQRTGIKERHIADSDEVTSDLGVKAGRQAIERSGLDPKDIDVLICATISPDHFCMPSTANLIAHKLKLNPITSFDISAACTGFIYALNIAKSFIESGAYKNVLIIGAEKLSTIIDYTDRGTCILFGDGAGAAVISGTEDREKAIIDIHTGADGSYSDYLITPGGGSAEPCSITTIENRRHFMKMQGNATFKVAVKTLTKDVIDILKKNKIKSEDIKHFIPHQANYRIIKAVGDALSLRDDQVILTVHKYGNTSSASIPMAMNDLWEKGGLNSGDLVLLDAFGGGLTWGSAILKFGGNPNKETINQN
jgi:3-oxoacyl-[acyl-carrier-protein] synthase-3